MLYLNKFQIKAFSVVCLVAIFYLIIKPRQDPAFQSENDAIKSECVAAYRKNCLNLFKKLRNPDKHKKQKIFFFCKKWNTEQIKRKRIYI